MLPGRDDARGTSKATRKGRDEVRNEREAALQGRQRREGGDDAREAIVVATPMRQCGVH